MQKYKKPIVIVMVLAVIAALFSTLILADNTGTTSDATPSDSGLAAEVATYELLTGSPNRFLIGLFTSQGTVSYGTADMRFYYLGTEANPVSARPGPTATGSFILVPNDDAGQPPATDQELQAAAEAPPALTQPDQVRGVYQADGVTFDRAGFWRVDVTVPIDGTDRSASASFQVVDKPSYPAIGQKAPLSQNLLYRQKGVDPITVDSRAAKGWASVPDKTLHSITVKDALAQHVPVVVVVSTPLYCQSRFCGPVTNEIQALAAQYSGRDAGLADFIHIEIWKDYQNKVINKAAAQWVYRNKDVTEPWVFLIGTDGKILDRWQNVLDRSQLQSELALLTGKAGA